MLTTSKMEPHMDLKSILWATEMKDYEHYAPLDSITIPLHGYAESPTLGEVKMYGYKSRNRKYPYIVEEMRSGKLYKITTWSAKRLVEVI